jgi:DNA-directed RNA polymerase subunit M/transcription elongation factor TFIIS
MTKAEIITLAELYAVCPQCGEAEWYVIPLRTPIKELDDILGLQCVRCGFRVEYREEP